MSQFLKTFLNVFKEMATPATFLAAMACAAVAVICLLILSANPAAWRPVFIILWGLIIAYYGFHIVVLPVILYRRKRNQRNSQN